MRTFVKIILTFLKWAFLPFAFVSFCFLGLFAFVVELAFNFLDNAYNYSENKPLEWYFYFSKVFFWLGCLRFDKASEV